MRGCIGRFAGQKLQTIQGTPSHTGPVLSATRPQDYDSTVLDVNSLVQALMPPYSTPLQSEATAGIPPEPLPLPAARDEPVGCAGSREEASVPPVLSSKPQQTASILLVGHLELLLPTRTSPPDD